MGDWINTTIENVSANITCKKKVSESVVCINMDCLDSGTGQLLALAESDLKSDKTAFQKENVLFGKLRPYLRKYWYAAFDAVCSSEILVLRAFPNIASKYLYYIVSSESFIEYINARTFGTKMPRTSWGITKNYNLDIPVNIAEQSKIAEVLATVDDTIVKTRALIDKYKNIKAGMMQDLLLGGKWKVDSFSTIADINPRTVNNISPLTEVSFIPMQDVDENGIWVTKESRLAKDCFSGFTRFTENDVLFAKITPCMENGKGCIAEELISNIGFGSTEFHVLRAKPNAVPRFIYQWSISPYLREKAITYMTGSAGQQRVSADFFTNLQIGIPPKHEQQIIANQLTAVDQKIQTERDYLTKLQDIKRGLMQDLLTNTVSVDALM